MVHPVRHLVKPGRVSEASSGILKPDTGRVKAYPTGINGLSVAGGFWFREAEQQVTIVLVLFLA
jgi:hypothetical protein